MTVKVSTRVLTDLNFVPAIEDRDRDGFLSVGDTLPGHEEGKPPLKVSKEHVDSLSHLADFLERVTGRKKIFFTTEDSYLLYSGHESSGLERILDLKNKLVIPVSQSYQGVNLIRLNSKIEIRASACSQKKPPEKMSCERDWEQKRSELQKGAEVFNKALGQWDAVRSALATAFDRDEIREDDIPKALEDLSFLNESQRKFQKLSRDHLGETSREEMSFGS